MSIFDKLFKRKRKLYSFTPDYAVPPSETIMESMEHSNVTRSDLFIAATPIKLSAFNNMMDDVVPISHEMSMALSEVLGADAAFWKKLSRNYFESLKKRGEK
jgi:HTH-type transcriptional regulator / antitoxin HigA